MDEERKEKMKGSSGEGVRVQWMIAPTRRETSRGLFRMCRGVFVDVSPAIGGGVGAAIGFLLEGFGVAGG